MVDGGLMVDPGGGGTDDPRDLPVREKVCDENGQNCTCLRLALLGTLESAANNKDTQPFVDWLNQNSGGTATVTMVTEKPTLDAAYLSGFDILLVANVNSWTFSEPEKAAVETWVKETGGGIVALTGFVSTDAEITASSQLLSFAGMGFAAPKTAENGHNEPVYFGDNMTQNLKSCLPGDAIITSPIRFTPQAGSLDTLSFELDYVGGHVGWTALAPEGATVVATDPVTGGNMAVAKEVDGKGRLLAFGDEWVIFANQWEGASTNMQMDMHNICYVPATDDAEAYLHGVATLYQTKQFWYNAINWVAPPNECGFTVDDPDVVVK